MRVPRRITAREYQDELNGACRPRDRLGGGRDRRVAGAGRGLSRRGQALAIGCGRRWAAIRDDWPAVWQSVPVRVTVKADVGRTFDLRDGIDTSGGGT
ncbi:MAG: hypothetical protein ACLRRN_07685 [Oscillospiraceae bacterium]